MKNVVQFFQEVNRELLKVVWPKFDEWMGATVVMLFLVVLFSVYLGFVDFGFTKLASWVFSSFGL